MTNKQSSLQGKREQYAFLVANSKPGPERTWAYQNLTLLDGGFYSSDDLIDLSTSNGFSVLDPFTRIRRGTTLEKGVTVGQGCAILGRDVKIGSGTTLDRAIISGNRISIGKGNRLVGDIEIDRLIIGDNNDISGLLGDNEGHVSLGNGNRVSNVRIANKDGGAIAIGNRNDLWPGLSINNPFPDGKISIGHHNSLGRDGGGVISSSYRFGRGWTGDVFLGVGVEMTRGAEILGFSVLGWPGDILSSVWKSDEAGLIRLITTGSLAELSEHFARLREVDIAQIEHRFDKRKTVSLFGTVKVKRSIMTGKVSAKDDTRTLCAFIRDALTQERSKIYYSSIAPSDLELMSISAQDCALEHVEITMNQDWESFPKTLKADAYPPSDAEYYQDWSWDKELGR